MARGIFKPNIDRNEYIEWTTTLNRPTTDPKTRDEMAAYLKRAYGGADESIEWRMKRADMYGSSWMDKGMWWDVQHEVGDLHGTVHHQDLANFARAAEGSPEQLALVRPNVDVEYER